MTVAQDTDPKLAAYAHPERLVTTAWLAEHLGTPASSSSSPTRTCCSTTPATSRAR